MRSTKIVRPALLAALALCGTASAQLMPIGLAPVRPTETTTTLGVPGSFGGVEFDALGTTLYLGSDANNATATVKALPVLRDPVTNRINGYGPATTFCGAPNIDGGLAFQGSLLYFTTYPNNQLGQFNGVTTTTFALPNTGTTGGLAFVPSGYPNAGTLLVSTYGAGVIYEITLQTLANGFKQPIAASVWCDLSTVGRYYLEGMRFIPSGPHAGDLLVCDYNGPVLRLDVDANGLPAGGALNPSVEETAVFGNTEGLAFDPVTKDLLVSIFTFAELHQIAGYDSFQALTVEPSSFVSTATESATRLQIRAGSINYLRSYILAASASGTVPGTPVGSVVVPLNIDFLTLTVLQYANTPLFDGVVGTTGLFGEATATINLPALNVVGPVATDWAFLLLSPEDFASNPAPIVLTP